MSKWKNHKLLYIVVLTAALLLALTSIAMAAVWTDQQDYVPGSVVTISGDNSDGAGYVYSDTVKVDVTGPNGYTSSCQANPDVNGAWSCQVTLNDDDSAVGEYSYTANGSISGTSQSGTFTDAYKTITTVLLTTGTNPSGYGTSLTFTSYTKKDADNSVVTVGQVEFRDGALQNCNQGTVVKSLADVDSNGQVTYSTSTLSVGTHTIRACYKGTGGQGSGDSTGTVSQIVNKASATVTLSNLTQTYNGSPLTPTALTDPVGLTIAWTNAPQTGPGSYEVTATVNDANYQGFSSGTFVISQADNDAPTINCTVPNQAIWYGSDVSVPCTASDSGSGLANPSDANFNLSTSVAGGNESSSAQTNSHEVCDNNGNCATAGPYTFKVDKKAPEFVCGSSDSNWHADNQSVSCTASDGGSGLADPLDASFSLTTSVADGEETASAATNSKIISDSVGNSATAGPYYFMVDKKLPQLTSCDVPDGLWYSGDVTLYCHYTDGGSGPATQDVSLVTNVAAGTETANAVASAGGAKACDTVGNCADTPADIAGNMVDKKAPQLTSCDMPDGVWHASDVTLYCHYTDGGSGPATQDVSLVTNVAAGTETADAVASAGGAKACDTVGNCADTPDDIAGNMVDKKAPQITSCDTPDGVWHASDVTLYCHYTDGGSGPATQDVSLTTNVVAGTETADAAASAGGAQACDDVDNCAASPADISGNKVDKKAPALTGCDSPDGLWHVDDVTLYCHYTDGGSGPATQDVSLTTNVVAGTETADAAASAGDAQACDAVGNCAASPADIAGNKVDKKAPQLTTCDVPDGLWHAGDVTLYCHYTDAGSGPATQDVSLSTSVTAGIETADAAASAGGAQACDAVGNCAASPADIAGNKVDKKAPQLTTCDVPDGLWHADDVTLYCHYTDGGSGPATQDVSLTTNVVAGTETADAAASASGAQACDAVGNCAASPADIAGNKVDKKAPTITITVPAATDYTLNQIVKASYTCVDGGSGVASCAGTVANGSNIDTASVGSKTFTVNSTDNVGNIAAPASVTYSVKYATGGTCYGGPGHSILQPINTDGTSVFKQKSTVPAKFRVCDANGVSIGTPGVVSSFRLIQTSNGTVSDVDEVVISTTPDTAFRWSASDQQWIFNINTKNLSAGKTYVYRITLNDSSTIDFQFGLK
jgi:hypothetical protein